MTTFIGATVWEGAATVALSGQLPDTGYYAATNSFPRNTVVDVTNLENGKSVRVIVVAGIETPGLLAILSRNAANTIGLSGRSIGRIRIAQLSDPIAFSRFTDGLSAGGDPDYNPRGQSIDESVYAPETAQTASRVPSSGFFPESEWADDGYRDIVDLPDSYSPNSYAPPPALAEERTALQDTPFFEHKEIAPLSDAKPQAIVEIVEQYPVQASIQAQEIAPIEYPAEPDYPALLAESTEAPALLECPVEPDYPALLAESTEVPALTNKNENYDYSLVPAEERPPEAVYNIDEKYVLPNIADAKEILPDESLFIDPLEMAKEEPQRVIDETLVIAPIDTQPQIDSTFSVPVIGRLEQGKYYVQLGAFNKEEQVEDEISRIGKLYPLAVQNGGSDEKPMYRILLGPLNLGESGAVLQRFKTIGYPGAFVRKN
jgi:hypothetical protein